MSPIQVLLLFRIKGPIFGAVHSVRMIKQKILFVASFLFDERKKKERKVIGSEGGREGDKLTK